MDSRIFKNVTTITIDIKKNVYLRSWDRDDVEVRYLDSDLADFEQIDQTVLLSGQINCLISSPKDVTIIVEHVGGNCEILGDFANMTIENVGGNLGIESIDNGLIEKVGGNLRIGAANGSLIIEKVGGNLHIANKSSALQIERVGGNLYASGKFGAMDSSVGGNIKIFVTEIEPASLTFSAGGNISLSYHSEPNFHIIAKAGANYRIETQNEKINGHTGRVDHVFGNGSAQWTLKAGGNLHIFPTESADLPAFSFEASDDSHWDEIANRRFDFGSAAFDKLNYLDEEISEKIMRKKAKAEDRIQKAMEKLNRKLDWENTSFTGVNWSTNDVEKKAAKSPSEPVTEEERMIILRMLQDKKITAEEAEKLLDALDQS